MPELELDLELLLKQVIALCEEASCAIMQVYRSTEPLEVKHKSKHQPVTIADKQAHQILADGLSQLTPQLPVLSEEATADEFSVRKQWDYYWLVDPLDGTKEFIHGYDDFTVNVALIAGHQPILGVVTAPVSQTCYFAAKGHGAFKSIAGQPASELSICQPGNAPLRFLVSRHHASQAGQSGFFAEIGDHELVVMGSSIKFCALAEGSADVYLRLGPTSEWDTAAGHCVLEIAGGQVVDAKGHALRYNTKSSLLNPPFLAIGDPSVDSFTMMVNYLEKQ